MDAIREVSIQASNPTSNVHKNRDQKPENILPKRRDCIAIKKKLMRLVNNEEYNKTLMAYLHGTCSKQFYDEKMNSILTTPTAKIIHNKLVRSILYNACFSLTPPPNVEVPHPQVPLHIQNSSFSSYGIGNPFFSPPLPNWQFNLTTGNRIGKNLPNKLNSIDSEIQKFNSFNASNSKCLPSVNNLAFRIDSIISQMNLDSADIFAVKIISKKLKELIINLLDSCVVLHKGKSDEPNQFSADLNSTNNENITDNSPINVSDVLNVIEMDKNLYSFVSLPVLSKYSSIVNK